MMRPAPRFSTGPKRVMPQSANPWSADASFKASQLATRTLIVEDEAMIAWSLESYLEDIGFTDIEIVANGDDAISAAQTRRPGLIISDINLGSGADGITTAATISTIDPVSIVFISGYVSTQVRNRIAQELPSALILAKPVQLMELRAAIVAVLPPFKLQ